jgi:predicted 2-oxoglutarate/Fe(II)-dependent dioxygenase YbiX
MEIVQPATCINIYKKAIETKFFMYDINMEINNQWSEIQWTNSSVGGGNVGQYRTSTEANISHLPSSQSTLGQRFKEISNTIIDEIIPDYTEEHLVTTSGYEGWRLLKYSGGGEYHSHYDHSPANSRIVSLVAFLEEPEEGGELEFPFFKVKIKPEIGDVVVFPSNFPYVHIAHPVTAGTKCSLVTWFQ